MHCTAQRLFLLRSCTLFDLPILFIKKKCFKFLNRLNIVIEETDCCLLIDLNFLTEYNIFLQSCCWNVNSICIFHAEMIITLCNHKVIFITHAVLKNVLSSDCSSDCVPLMQRAVYGIFASWLKSACFYIVIFVRSHIFDCINVSLEKEKITNLRRIAKPLTYKSKFEYYFCFFAHFRQMYANLMQKHTTGYN